MRNHRYKEVWCVDFEFRAPSGELPNVRCLVAHEMYSGKTIRLWREQMGSRPPYSIDKDALFVAYYASAEIGCHLSLGWGIPENIFDCFAEHRVASNCLTPKQDMLTALEFIGVGGQISSVEKEGNRELAMRKGDHYTDAEKKQLLAYCETDVMSCVALFNQYNYTDNIKFDQALLRGKYMSVVAGMEHRGIPINKSLYHKMIDNWEYLRKRIVAKYGEQFNVFTPKYAVDSAKFQKWLESRGLDAFWPRTPSTKRPKTDKKTLETMAKGLGGDIQTLKALKAALSELKLTDLSVGDDGRNRVLLSPFRAKTGRNQPSTTKFIFGPSKWIRNLIKPRKGRGIAYIDYASAEIGIAAALSGDKSMQHTYWGCDDPYIAFAQLAHAVPPNATKQTHPRERALYKTCALAVQYGMSEYSLKERIQRDYYTASKLMQDHKRIFATYWEWNNNIINTYNLIGKLELSLGWTRHYCPHDNNYRSVGNTPVQGNGAEMLRLSCILAQDAGIELLAPVHDALLIEADEADLPEAIRVTRGCMEKASEIILGGLRLRTDVDTAVYPASYAENRENELWKFVVEELENV